MSPIGSRSPTTARWKATSITTQWALSSPGNGFSGTAIFFLIFSLFWNAISWTLFISALNQGERFPVLFLIPFILIGLITFLVFIFLLKGVFSILIDRDACHAVWSIHKLKHSKRFATSEITDVVEDVVYTKNYQPVYGVGIKYGSKRTLKFGSGLSEEERKWCIGEIKHFLASSGRHPQR